MGYKNKQMDRTYKAWNNMVSRCANEKHQDYHHYGEKGITVCARWKVFENFLNDMGLCLDSLELDRIDNDKGYEPFNCRWANRFVQNANRGTPKGYTWNKYHKKYEAQIKRNNKRMFLGYFDFAEDAQSAYFEAKNQKYAIDNRPEIVKKLQRSWETVHAIL